MYGVPLDRFTIHGLALDLALAICCILLGVGGRPPAPEAAGLRASDFAQLCVDYTRIFNTL